MKDRDQTDTSRERRSAVMGAGFTEQSARVQKRSFVLGIDISDEKAQISYMMTGASQPDTLSVKAGADEYDVPVILAKSLDEDRWLYGREAVAALDEDKDKRIEPVRELLSKAAAGGERIVDGESYDNVSLLSLYLKRLLSLLSMEMDRSQITTVVFTTADHGREVADALEQAAGAILPDCQKIECRYHEESLYHYMLAQPPELMNRDVLAFDYNYGVLEFYDMRTNHRTRPVVVTVRRGFEKNLDLQKRSVKDNGERSRWLDEEFLRVCSKACSGRIVSTVHLLGKAFGDGWMHKSLEYLCRTRRVFQGDNLFSKGACLAAAALADPGREEGFVLLDEDKLRANLGITVIRRGEKAYLPLLDAGANWYDAGREVDLIHEYGDTLDIHVLPLTGGAPKDVALTLPELPERPARCTRLRLLADMAAPDTVRIRVTDMGFGELFLATDAYSEEIVRL